MLLWGERLQVEGSSGRITNYGGKGVSGVNTSGLEIELREPNELLDGLNLKEPEEI